MVAWMLACWVAGAGDLETHHRQTVRLDDAGMSVVLGMGAASVVSGGVGWALNPDTEWRAFHQMTLGWGLVNAALGVNGLVNARAYRRHPPEGPQAYRVNAGKQRLYAMMVGMDFAYVSGGALLWARGTQGEDPRSIGYGRAILLQGVGLLAFDATMLLAHGRLGKRLWAVPGGFAVQF